MPIYEYRHMKKSTQCKEYFEIIEVIHKESIVQCPNCHEPVERLLSTFTGKTNVLSDGNLKEKGFTKLVRDNSTGKYRKIV